MGPPTRSKWIAPFLAVRIWTREEYGFAAFFSDPDAAPLVANAPVSDMIITSEELKKVIDSIMIRPGHNRLKKTKVLLHRQLDSLQKDHALIHLNRNESAVLCGNRASRAYGGWLDRMC